jgi:hypothetical protein
MYHIKSKHLPQAWDALLLKSDTFVTETEYVMKSLHIQLALKIERRRKPQAIVGALKKSGIGITTWWKKGLFLFVETVTTLTPEELESKALTHHGVRAAYANS